MAASIRRVKYFYATIHDRPGEAYQLLSHIAAHEINLLAFSAIPIGADHAQLQLFPDDPDNLIRAAERTGMKLSEPHCALLIQGDDDLGALADIHRKLADKNINVYSSHGVTDGRGRFGYVLFLRHDKFEEAAEVLGV